MSRSLSVATAIEKAQTASATPFLLLVDVTVVDPLTGDPVEVLSFVNNNEDIVFHGVTYIAAAFDLQLKQESGAQPDISLSFNDFTGVVQQRMQQYQGGVGFTVVISVVNSGNLAQPAEVVEYFECIASSSNQFKVNFTLGAESALGKPFPKRRQMRDFCAWKYKGNECKYAGGLASCDLTLEGANGCAVHSNVINFGAFPGISTGSRYG